MAMKTVKRDRPKDVRKTAAQLFAYFGKHNRLLLLVTVLVVISAVANIIGVYMIKPVINKYVMPADLPGLFKGVVITASVYAAGVLSNLGYTQVMVRLAQKIVFDIRRDLFSSFQKLPLRYFDTNRHGDLMSLFTNDVDTVSEALNNSFAGTIQYFIQIVGTLTVLIVLNVRLSLIVMAGYVCMFAWIFYSSKRSKFFFDEQQKNLGALDGFIEETVSGQKVVKVFNHEEENMVEFRVKNLGLQKAGTSAQRYASTQVPMVVTISFLNYTAVAVVGSIMAINGQMDVGGLASYLVFVRQAAMPINRFVGQSNVILNALAGAERIFRAMNTEPEKDEGRYILQQTAKDSWSWKDTADPEKAPVKLCGDVKFNHVTFAYRAGHTILKDISLYAKPGQKIALVGSTGAGKTTITNLITRFYDIEAGSITYDGIDIRDIRKDSLRQSLGMVLQDTHLFTGSIGDNIRFGKPDATDEEVEKAAGIANADSFIRRLPEGYRTVITGDGENLSQGQRQLIAIARTAIADPPVLILDEATSSIDTRTEALIEKGMDRLMEGRTVFVIAHRLSTVRNANAILVLEHGTIIERGDHEELLKQRGEYYQLYNGMFELN